MVTDFAITKAGLVNQRQDVGVMVSGRLSYSLQTWRSRLEWRGSNVRKFG